jgi:hypothetical protein
MCWNRGGVAVEAAPGMRTLNGLLCFRPVFRDLGVFVADLVEVELEGLLFGKGGKGISRDRKVSISIFICAVARPL